MSEPGKITCFMIEPAETGVLGGGGQEWRRVDNGEIKTFNDWNKAPGAMWDQWWYEDFRKGPDGLHLAVICPDGGHWDIDGSASNCTWEEDTGKPDYSQREHHCWIRHGTPPMLTVDKNGKTCRAGAGSIGSRNGYHGFLQNGVFT